MQITLLFLNKKLSLIYPYEFEKYKSFENIPNFILKNIKNTLRNLKQPIILKTHKSFPSDFFEIISENKTGKRKFSLDFFEIKETEKLHEICLMLKDSEYFIVKGDKIMAKNKKFCFFENEKNSSPYMGINFDEKPFKNFLFLNKKTKKRKTNLILKKGILYIKPYENEISIVPHSVEISDIIIFNKNKFKYHIEMRYDLQFSNYKKNIIIIHEILLIVEPTTGNTMIFDYNEIYKDIRDLSNISDKELMKLVFNKD